MYPSNLSNVEGKILEPLLPTEKPGGRHRGYGVREIINAIQYLKSNPTTSCGFTKTVRAAFARENLLQNYGIPSNLMRPFRGG